MFITLYAFLAWRCSVCSTAIRSDSRHDPDADELFLSISADGALVEMQSQQSRHNETDAIPTTGAKYEATFAGTMGVSMRIKPNFCVTRLINSLGAEGADDELSAIIEEDEDEDERDLAEQAEKERKLAEQERKRKLAEQQRKLAELIARALLRKGACVGDVWEYYRFIEVVGEGQFGTVYRAASRGDGKVVAVKELHFNLAHFNPLEVEPPRLHLPQNSEILEVYLTQDLDISGYYWDSDGTTKSLTQSGSRRGFSTTKRWSYTVSGNKVTIDGTEITGVISGSAGSYTIKWSNGAEYTQQQDCFVGIWMREGDEIRITRYRQGDGDYYDIKNSVVNTTVEVAQWNRGQIELLGVIGDCMDGTIKWRSTWSEWKKARSPPLRPSLVYVYYPKGNLMTFLTDHIRDLRLQFEDETLTLPASDVHLFARQIALGLRLLHGHGFLHRDLKPENILVVLEPGAEDYEISRHKLVITDYGTVVDGCSKGNPDCASGKTGTPYYMAKAQFEGKGKKYGAEVDWHAFGVILYQLALGMDAHPFQTKNESDDECVQNILEQQPNLDPILGKGKYLYDLLSLLLSKRVNDIPSWRWWEGKRHPVLGHDYWILEPNTQATHYSSHLEFWKAVCAQSLSRGLDGHIFPSGGVDFNALGPEAVERCTNIGDTADWKAVTLCQH